MPESRSFLALAARLACFSGLSRALGLVRDLCIAWIMGTGPLADMLAQALRLPHIFRRLLAEGVLSLPLTQAFMQGGGSSLPSDCLPAQLFTVLHRKLLFLLLPLLLLALLFSPLLARLLAGSFLPPAPALVLLLCLVLPYLFCVCMAALCMAYLHAQNVFWVSAFSPVLFNILLLLALFLAHLFPRDASLLIALALTLSGGVQWLFQRHFALRCVLAAEVKKLDGSERLGDTCQLRAHSILRSLPLGLFASSGQHLCLLVTMCALSAGSSGQASALMYAERILELPLGIIGVCLGTASLPLFGRAAARGAHLRVRRLLDCALHMTWLLILPATSGLWAIGMTLAEVLFGHGEMDAEGVRVTAEMLIRLLPLLPACAILRVLLTAVLAERGLFSAFFSTLLAVCVTFVCCLLGLHPAYAAACGLYLQTGLFFFWLRHLFVSTQAAARPSVRRLCFIVRALLCAALTGLAAFFCLSGTAGPGDAGETGLFQLGCALAAGLLIWLLSLAYLCPREIARLRRRFVRS